MLIAVISLSILSACGGGSSGGSPSTNTSNPAPSIPTADYTISNKTLRLYEPGDHISYEYSADETYEDGNGSYVDNATLDWTVVNDPYEFTLDDDRKSLIAVWETEYDGFREDQIYEQFYQYTGLEGDREWENNAYSLYGDLDMIYLDSSSWNDLNDKMDCFSYDIDENVCYNTTTTPGTFNVGAYWNYEGKSKRSRFDTDHFDTSYAWEVTRVEVVDTPMGRFEAYALDFTKEVSYQTCCERIYFKTEGTYWYYPDIGIIKGEITKSQRFSGYSDPFVKMDINFSIEFTNIPF